MVIRGLENYGEEDLAREIALKHVSAVADVYKETGTIWENYAPDAIAPGRHVDGAPVVRDMVGWSGIGPILYFLEYGVGLRPHAPQNRLAWSIRSMERSGCERFRFNGHLVSVVARPEPGGRSVLVTVDSDGAFTLDLRYREIRRSLAVPAGHSDVLVEPE
jgi:hypothetical protein